MKKAVSLLVIASLSLAALLAGCASQQPISEPPDSSSPEGQNIVETGRRIRVVSAMQTIVFQLNDSAAAQALYEQLPLNVQVEDYAGSEKIFYPPEALDVNDTPLAEGPAGTLAYYAPWGDVAIFYGECRGANGLYALGEVISGGAQIESLTGEVRIEKVVDEVGICLLYTSDVYKRQGLQCEVSILSWSNYQKELSAGNFDLALCGFSIPLDGDLSFMLSSTSSQNYGGYSSATMDQYLATYTAATTESQIKSTAADIQRLFSQDLPLISLYFRTNTLVTSASIKGIQGARDMSVYREVEQWYILQEGDEDKVAVPQ